MKVLKIVGYVSICILAVIWLLWWGCAPHRPSDASLERRFNRERPELEHLVRMVDEDRNMARIAPGFTWRQDNVAWPRPESEWGISRQRWDEYKKLFGKLGLSDGITRREKSSDVLLDIWSWGIVPSGISVSYLYCGQPRNGYAHTEPPCIEKKDSGGTEDNYGDGYRYKRIDQGWYIYEESN